MRSEPASQPSAGLATPVHRLHVVTPLFLLIKQARALFPLLAIALFQRRAFILVAGLLVLMALTVLQWWRRTWRLDGRTLRVEEGVFGRKLRVVPFDRIQQVTLRRKLIHRLLGVATLRVETAGGGGGSEVDLDVISLAEAERLRETLLAARAGVAAPGAVAAPEVAAPAERVVVRLGLGQVVLAGVTGARAAAALAVLGPLMQYGDDLHLTERLFDQVDPERLLGLSALAVAALAALAVVVWFVLSAGASILTDYGFTLSLRGDDLVVRRGLLERREAVVPRARVQVVRLDESLLRRALGLGTLRVFSAGRAGREDRQADRVAVPVLPRSRYAEVIGQVMQGAAGVPELRRPPPRARRRQVSRRLLRTAPFALALAALPVAFGRPALTPAALTLFVLPLALAALLGLLAWRGLGHAVRADGLLYARYGALIRSTVIVPLAKAQSCRVRSTVFQRRAGLATTYVDVAAGGVHPRVVDEGAGRADELFDIVLARP
jgi:putative membrane protein